MLQHLLKSEPKKVRKLIRDEIDSVKTSNQQISAAMKDQIITKVLQAIQDGNVENKQEMGQFIERLLQVQAKGQSLSQGAAEEPQQAEALPALPADKTSTDIRALYKPKDHPALNTNPKKEDYIELMFPFIKLPKEKKVNSLSSYQESYNQNLRLNLIQL
jgi:hypothetical protein